MSTTQEYYIRKASETDARGPFTLEQLSSLAENGQVDPETYYYDAATENWVAIGANNDLLETLFPAKKNLRVKPKTDAQVKALNTVSADDRPITVNDMLLAAEGRTADTRDKADPAISERSAAAVGLYSAMAILFVTALAYILPHIDVLFALDFGGMLRAPLLLLGLLQLVLGLCLALGAVGAYPAVRFAAMLGLGLSGLVFYLQGDLLPMAFTAAATIGLFVCTLVLNLPGALLAGVIGFVGACGLAHHLFTT
jgi:hypothetical protein